MIKVLDLFSGAGGLSYGFHKDHNFNVVQAIDNDKDAVDTYNLNYGSNKCIVENLIDLEPRETNFTPDVIISGPPCQGFSDARGSRSANNPRNNLINIPLKWAKELIPKIILIENVKGILSLKTDKGISFANYILKKLNKMNFHCNIFKIKSEEFGVPQKRRRVFFLGVSKNFETDNIINELKPKLILDHLENIGLKILPKDLDIHVKEALNSLGKPYKIGSITEFEKKPTRIYYESTISWYDDYLRYYDGSLKEKNTVHDNYALEVNKEDKFAIPILSMLNEGQAYRSNRGIENYVTTWQVFGQLEKEHEHYLNEKEQKIIQFIAENENDDRVKIFSDKERGPVKTVKIEEHFNSEYKENEIRSICKDLSHRNWLRAYDSKKKENNHPKVSHAFWINSKSGIRPIYQRLPKNDQANTILASQYRPRNIVHYSENRAPSLRELARLQSFPDWFAFSGNFASIAKQIGNAVPPLLSVAWTQKIKKFFN